MTQFVDKSQKIDLLTDAHCAYKSFPQKALMAHILRRNNPFPTRGGGLGIVPFSFFVIQVRLGVIIGPVPRSTHPPGRLTVLGAFE